MVFFGSLIQYGTSYLGNPKGDHNFDDHPSVFDESGSIRGCLGLRLALMFR